MTVTRRWTLSRTAAAALAAMTLVTAACGDDKPGSTSTIQVNQPGQFGGQHIGGSATGDTEAGAAFARWVLEQDPRRQYITDAVVRNEQTLGVRVQPNATKGELQQLLVSLAGGMARTFPNRALDVVAFYQSGDKLAEARYDPRTGRVNVRFT